MKMKYTNNIHTITYDVGDGFYVDIVKTPKIWESWIYHKEYGSKSLMFGIEPDEMKYKHFKDCVEFELSESKKWYRDEVMDR